MRRPSPSSTIIPKRSSPKFNTNLPFVSVPFSTPIEVEELWNGSTPSNVNPLLARLGVARGILTFVLIIDTIDKS